jgi:hypothetical protein
VARLVERGLRESRAIDLEALVVLAGALPALSALRRLPCSSCCAAGGGCGTAVPWRGQQQAQPGGQARPAGRTAVPAALTPHLRLHPPILYTCFTCRAQGVAPAG